MLSNIDFVSSLILVVLINIDNSVMTNGEVTLSIDTPPQFPHPIDKSFDVNIISSTDNETIDDSIEDLLLVRITDPSGMTLEKSIFEYGMKDKIDREFIGQFIRIPTWRVSKDRRSINLSIWLTKDLHNKILEIYKINASSKKIRQQILDNLKFGKIIYRSNIDILIPPKLKLSVNGINGNKNVFTVGDVAIVTCQVIEAIPKRMPIFTNLTNFTIKANSMNLERSSREVMILISMSDHLKNIICSAGPTNLSINFKVFHHPASVFVIPEFGDVVKNDSILHCSHRGGYPIPTVQWRFVEGPANGTKSYNISTNGHELYMKVNSILDNPWKFNCSVTSSFLNSTQISNKTFSFIVQENPGNHIDYLKKLILNVKEIKLLTNKYETLLKDIQDIKLAYRIQEIFNADLLRSNKEIQRQIKKSKESNENNEKEITRLNHQLQIQNYGDFIWKFSNFSQTIKHGKTTTYSDTFDSHRNGYKLILFIPSIGQLGVTTYLAIYFQIRQGPFDDILHWPMTQTISIGIINQDTKSDMFTKKFSFGTTVSYHQYVFNRTFNEKNHGFGDPQLVKIDDLLNNPSLCKNDVVYIKCSVTPS